MLTYKDKAKLFIFPAIISMLNKLGVSYNKTGKVSFFAFSNLLAQAKSLSKFKIEDNAQKQRFYILTMLPGSVFNLTVESLIALGLKRRGHEVTFILDDNSLPLHEFKKSGNEKRWNYQSLRDFILASTFLSRLGLKMQTISEFVQDGGELQYDIKYDNILEASLMKHYKVGIITDNLPFLSDRKNLFKRSIAITNYIGEQLVKMNPDGVIMSHGIYSTWGPPFQILDTNKIPVLVHARGKIKRTHIFNWNKTGDNWDVSEEWERIKGTKLSPLQKNTILEYLDSRIMHTKDNFAFNFGSATNKNETLKLLGLKTDKPIYTLFTNVLWDAASAQREIAFSDPVEWVIETIAWFNEHPEKQLVLKIHPAEKIIGTNMPFYDLILSKITPKPNIIVIKPEAKVNSSSIYDITDLGLVHTTTAGMELPLVNKPCVVVSRTHYRGKGFTIDINSKEEYFDTLENFKSSMVNTIENRELAIKYAHLLFMRFQIPFDMFFEENSADIRGFRYRTIDEYMNYESFRNIISCIEKKTPVLND